MQEAWAVAAASPSAPGADRRAASVGRNSASAKAGTPESATQGQKVIVIDRGKIAGGITARTTAHLAPLCDDLTSELIKLRGEDLAKAFYQSQVAAINRIEEIQEKHAIECDFRRLDGYLFQASDTDAKIIDGELDAVRKVGAPVHRVSAFHWSNAPANLRCVILGRQPFIRSNICKPSPS
jgi:hypothetical protein